MKVTSIKLSAAFLIFGLLSMAVVLAKPVSILDFGAVTTTSGMRNPDGSVHPLPAENVASKIINVVTRATQIGCKIDLIDNDHDDQACIQAIIEDAGTTAGTALYFPNGSYNLIAFSDKYKSAHLVITKSAVNIEGQSRDGTIFKSHKDDAGKASYSGITLHGVHDIVLKNFTFTNTWNKTYSTQTKGNSSDAGGLTNVIATGYNNISDQPTYNVIIDNVLVEKFRRMGVLIAAGSRDILVKNSIARNATDVGGGGAGYGFVIQGKTHQSAASNPFLGVVSKDAYFVTLDGNKTEGQYIRHAVIIQYWAHNNVVRNSHFDRTQLDAIDLHGEDEYDNEISHNVITNSYRAGIGLGNSGAGHDKSGVNNWIHHNTMINCNWGITVQYGTDKTTIEHNIIRDNSANAVSSPAGIVLGKSANSVLRNNTISDNTAPGFVAVLLRDDDRENESPSGGPSHWHISGNRVSNSGATLLNKSIDASNNRIQSTW
jgi:parallel beta-helix repeat protein